MNRMKYGGICRAARNIMLYGIFSACRRLFFITAVMSEAVARLRLLSARLFAI